MKYDPEYIYSFNSKQTLLYAVCGEIFLEDRVCVQGLIQTALGLSDNKTSETYAKSEHALCNFSITSKYADLNHHENLISYSDFIQICPYLFLVTLFQMNKQTSTSKNITFWVEWGLQRLHSINTI